MEDRDNGRAPLKLAERKKKSFKNENGDFPGGPVVKNPPSKARDSGSIAGQGTKIPPALGQLSPLTITREPMLRT